MRVLVLADIHGNVSALEAVLADASPLEDYDGVLLLGDYIDYGMRSNEIVSMLGDLEIPVIAALWGNHEHAVLEQDYRHFSSERGVKSAKRTHEHLSAESAKWLEESCIHEGKAPFQLGNMNALAVHGSLKDPLWKAIFPASADQLIDYANFDIVFSGHSHIPHAFSVFFEVDNPSMRNKKRTMFVNPGSVGQPRNHDSRAHYAVFDEERGISLRTCDYNIEYEQSLFNDEVDDFYRARLALGV